MDICGWYVTLVMWIFTFVYVTEGNVWRKSLEKELLNNSMNYLREQLLICLKTTEGGRGKRKADIDAPYWLTDLELQMDIDIMQNSQLYLMDRVIHCRKNLQNMINNVESVNLNQLLSTKVDSYFHQPSKYHKEPKNDVIHNPAGSRDTDLFGEPQREAEMAPYLGITDHVSDPPESVAPKPKVGFELDGRHVTCDSVNVNGVTFQCRDLRVDEFERLPNKDFCPSTYDSNRWRPIQDMASRTRDVVDLWNLCAVFGINMKVPGYTKNARVVWGCDDIKARLKWQNGAWAGYVDDNGFLHDLECVYSADIVWP